MEEKEENPILTLTQEVQKLQTINQGLLDYYREEARDLLEKNREIPDEIYSVFQTGVKGFNNLFSENLKQFSEVHMNLSDKDRNTLDEAGKQIKKLTIFSYYVLGLLLLAFSTTFLSGYYANKFYQSSILSKAEIRAQLLEEIDYKGKAIVDIDYIQALDNEKQILSGFLKRDKKLLENYALYRDGIINGSKAKVFFNKPHVDNELMISEYELTETSIYKLK